MMKTTGRQIRIYAAPTARSTYGAAIAAQISVCAAPDGRERPCSQFCNVRIETPSNVANCDCDRPVTVNTGWIHTLLAYESDSGHQEKTTPASSAERGLCAGPARSGRRRAQAVTAASAALSVALGRITAASLSASGL